MNQPLEAAHDLCGLLDTEAKRLRVKTEQQQQEFGQLCMLLAAFMAAWDWEWNLILQLLGFEPGSEYHEWLVKAAEKGVQLRSLHIPRHNDNTCTNDKVARLDGKVS